MSATFRAYYLQLLSDFAMPGSQLQIFQFSQLVGSRHSSFLVCTGTSIISISMVLDALFLCLFCTATFFVNTKTIIGPNQVGVNFCCGKNEELVVEGEPIGVSSTTDPSKAKAKCVPITDEEERSSLEERQIWVGRGDGNGGEMKTLKLLEVRSP